MTRTGVARSRFHGARYRKSTAYRASKPYRFLVCARSDAATDFIAFVAVALDNILAAFEATALDVCFRFGISFFSLYLVVVRYPLGQDRS
jgi:hypothetical protein